MEENQVSKPADMEEPNLLDDIKNQEEIKTDFEEPNEPEQVDTETQTSVESNESNEELDFNPLIGKLSEEIKFMDEKIDLKDIDNIKTLIQKGLDHDRKVAKLQEIENSEEMTYLKEKAKENGMEVKDFIKLLKEDEQRQEKIKEEEKLNEMILNGVPEDIAKEVIQAAKDRKELAKQKLELEQKSKEISKQEQKKAELMDFVNAFPDVKVEDIPKEVLMNAEKTNMKSAYIEYLYEQQKTKLEELEQEVKNQKSSPVTGVTTHGGVSLENEDPFIKALLG